MTSLTLRYFLGDEKKARGRAEQARLMAAEVGLTLKEDAVIDFDGLKKEGVLDFGSVPLLIDDDLNLVQGVAILLYIAKLGGSKYVGNNPKEEAKILSYALGAEDLRTKFVIPVIFAKDRDTALKEFKKNVVPRWYNNFTRLLASQDYFFGDDITAADIAIFDVLDGIQTKGYDALEDYPVLKAFHHRVSSRKNISKYLATRPESKF